MKVDELTDFTLLHVATRGDTGAAATALSARLDVEMDGIPGRVAGRDELRVLWFGPGRWLVHASVPGLHIEPVEGCAITDLTDSRRIFRLNGDDVRDYLAASCPLDLSEPVIPAGSCALTQFDRFSILLYRQNPESFDVYVERSFAPSLRLPAG